MWSEKLRLCLAANLTLFSMAKHTVHHAGIHPYLQKHAADYLYTYMSLICRYSTQVGRSAPFRKSLPNSCLVLTKVGETVSLEVVSTHEQFLLNVARTFPLKMNNSMPLLCPLRLGHNGLLCAHLYSQQGTLCCTLTWCFHNVMPDLEKVML